MGVLMKKSTCFWLERLNGGRIGQGILEVILLRSDGKRSFGGFGCFFDQDGGWVPLVQRENEVVNFKMRLIGLGGWDNTPMGVHRACQCWSDNERRWSNDWDV